MNHIEKLAIRQALEALAVDYWYEVDFNWGQDAHAYYTEDAVFTTSQKSRTGRAAIADFYNARQARGARTSLHVVQNFRVVPVSPQRVDCNYVMSQPDGAWLYALRTLRPLFRDDTPTTG